MDPVSSLQLALDPTLIFKAQGMKCDPWQKELLFCQDRQILLNCSRQAGKSQTVAALVLHTALFQPNSLILILSKSQRQAHELFRKVNAAYHALGAPVPMAQAAHSLSKLELANGSRIIGLPGKEETIRAFSGVTLLVIDEAAKVSDDLYGAVRPMVSVSSGRVVLLSTPFGQRGFFFREWHRHTGEKWRRVRITWRECPRHSAAFIAEEIEALGENWVKQEYECEFTAMEGLVYPNFPVSEWTGAELPAGQQVGGIDFGWRNPFAAVWGVLDRDDVLWIAGERYLKQTPLHEHASALRKVSPRMWYADPAGRTEIEELRASGLTVRKGDNDIRSGIAAVTARIRTGRLRVHAPSCPNLIDESRAYRYPRADEKATLGENPIDDHNHALAALRYLVSKLDARFIGKLRRQSAEGRAELETAPAEKLPEAKPRKRRIFDEDDSGHWVGVN